MKFDGFLDKFEDFVQEEKNIKAAEIVGSVARGTATIDSDIDLIIIVEDIDTWLSNREWINLFGKVVKMNVENWGKLKSLRVFYKDGLEVEFGFVNSNWVSDEESKKIMKEGFKLIVDKENVF